ncbi:hypothetical protein [Shimia sp. MIT1388]|uniref:hypothetical protein n=1 Tax=Shimia sp. MIT1388 TaxID=3096992 RepID=UPI003999F7FB
MIRTALISGLALLGSVSEAFSEPPDAWQTLERICREAPYETPNDAVAVAHLAGWRELDDAQLEKAANLFGSVWALEHPMLDIRSATIDEINATHAVMMIRFFNDLLPSAAGQQFGVLYLEAPEFLAFTSYRQSEITPQTNAFPCEIFLLGEASFLDDRFVSGNWQAYKTEESETVVQITDRYLSSVIRVTKFGENVSKSILTLPAFTVTTKRF